MSNNLDFNALYQDSLQLCTLRDENEYGIPMLQVCRFVMCNYFLHCVVAWFGAIGSCGDARKGKSVFHGQ